jgi:glucokinase
VDVIGIDVGGTGIKAIRQTADGAVVARDAVATPATSDALTAAVISLAASLREPATVAVGIACPGIVQDGVARYATNLPWRDEPVQYHIERALGLPVSVGRDVATAALAETAEVAGADVLFVALGTGIACAHVVGGVLHAGASGRAGEIGHTPVHPDGEVCACGQLGCLEVYASAAGIARRYAARAGRPLATPDIAARVTTDADAAAVWDDAVGALALALATDTLVHDPALIVLGGGLAEAGTRLFEPLRARLSALLAWRPVPPVVPARLGPAAGSLGAALLAWQAIDVVQQEGAPS